MSSVSVKILDLNKIAKDILEKLADNSVLKKRVRAAIEAVRPQISEAFIEAFRRTIVAKGLLGDFDGVDKDKDVQAHLGFEDGSEKVQEIENVLQEVIEISPFRKDRATYRFRFQSKDLAEYLLSEIDGSYDSDGGTVYWLEWLLYGGSVDIGILFSDKFKTSRTQRALMANIEGDWSTEDYNNFSESGINFINDMVKDPIWLEEVQNLVINKLREDLT